MVCRWWDGTDWKQESFPEDTLAKYEAPEPEPGMAWSNYSNPPITERARRYFGDRG